MTNLNLKGKIIVYGLAFSLAFGSGVLLSGPMKNALKKDPYKNKEAAVSFYQNYKALELEKIINKNNEVEIYLVDEKNNKKVKVGYDLITGTNEEIYSGLEQRLEQNVAENTKIIDNLFQDSYKLKIASNLGNKVKEGYMNPSEIELKYNETADGDFISFENKLTNENIALYNLNGKPQLGTIDYRIKGIKDELGNRAYIYFEDFQKNKTGIFDWFLNLFAGGS